MGNIVIKLTDEQIVQLVSSKEISLEISVGDNTTVLSRPVLSDGWPDTKGYEPAERLISFLEQTGFEPSDLPKLSRWRVGMLCRNNEYMYSACIGSYLRNYVWERVEQIEKLFGFRFSGCEYRTKDLSSHVERLLEDVRFKDNIDPGDKYRKILYQNVLREFCQHGIYTLADFKSINCKKERMRYVARLIS